MVRIIRNCNMLNTITVFNATVVQERYSGKKLELRDNGHSDYIMGLQIIKLSSKFIIFGATIV